MTQHFNLAELTLGAAVNERPYLEFLRSASMSVGLYVLRAGEIDGQQPHAEDEVYVVLRGAGRFSAADTVREVIAGDVIFVPAGVDHRFHDITADLELVVVFAPPETPPEAPPNG